ncbi:MAG: GIY-YIG nuclease family protein [Verrucomicrobiota bacterium]
MPSCFHYVYILESVDYSGRYYVGTTQDLKARLRKHNEGGVPHTAKYRPWRVKNAISFRDKDRAIEFERYLKSHSGRAVAKKRF